jgi:GAF domain-containing protein
MSDTAADALTAMSRFLIGDASFQETLLRVTEIATEVVPGADVGSITTLVEGRPRTAVFTDERSPRVDAKQYEAGEGPCLGAYADQVPYRIDSTRSDERWPAFARACVEEGLLSTLSLPLVIKHEGVGALNLYSEREGAFTSESEVAAGAFAQQAAIVLVNSQAYWDAHQLSVDLTEAMRSRSTIDQAIGILMAAKPSSPEEAFQLLVKASQRENRKVRTIAQEIVDRARGGRDSGGASARHG